jgi:hypothetical protein
MIRTVRRAELSESERRVWDAFPRGDWADLSAGPAPDPDPEPDPDRGPDPDADPEADPDAGPDASPHAEVDAHADPALDGGDGPGPHGPTDTAERPQVRAEVLSALLQSAPVPVDGRMPALRLRGARITGRIELSFGRVDVPVHLDDCVLDAAPDLTGAAVRTLALYACRLPGLDGRLLAVSGDLRLSDCEVSGCLMLEDAAISGSVSIGGSRLLNSGGRALSGGGMRVGGGFFARRGVHAEGSVRLIGARIDGGLFCEGASLSHPDGAALCADEVVTTRIICADGFGCEGEVQLRGAQVSGEVNLYGASLRAKGKALRGRGLTAGELILAPAQVSGLVDLTRARVGALRDSRATWPTRLRLDGFGYDQLLPLGQPIDVRARCAWLARDADVYRPHPYEQLAGYYRRLGHDDDARRVMVAKQRRRRRTLSPQARVGGYLLDGLVGYGYRAWLAGLWLGVLLVTGTAVFTARPPLAVDPTHQPHLDAFVYTLDLLIPIGAFGLRSTFVPVGGTRWVAYGLIAAGWILATALIAGVGRSLRRD